MKYESRDAVRFSTPGWLDINIFSILPHFRNVSMDWILNELTITKMKHIRRALEFSEYSLVKYGECLSTRRVKNDSHTGYFRQVIVSNIIALTCLKCNPWFSLNSKYFLYFFSFCSWLKARSPRKALTTPWKVDKDFKNILGTFYFFFFLKNIKYFNFILLS